VNDAHNDISHNDSARNESAQNDLDDWERRAATMTIAGESVAVIDVPAAPPAREYDAEIAPLAAAPPLLVVHGFPTSSIDFQPVIGSLSRGRHVVLVDLPGYGLSDKPDRAYSLFGQADVVEAVAAATGLTEVDLLTHDMGDSVGGELLARSLEGDLGFDIRRRVLTNGSIYLGLAQLTPGQELLRQLPDAALTEDAAPDLDTLTDALVELCAPDRRTDEVRRRLRTGAQLVRREGGQRLLPRLIRYIDQRAEHEERWTGAIEAHPAPLTVIWGRHDPIAVAAMADRLAERRPDATVVWLDTGHWPMVEAPAAFAEAAIDALD
jgi:pimeloyl-ACP methyl ester carboxylesterase